MDLTRVWNLMSYLYALNIGFSLYIERRRRKLVLIENRRGCKSQDFSTAIAPLIPLWIVGAELPLKTSYQHGVVSWGGCKRLYTLPCSVSAPVAAAAR
jgi:hypothetical protein